MAELAKAFVKIGSRFDDKGIKKATGGLGKLKKIAGKIAIGLGAVAVAGAAMGTALVIAAKKAADAAGVQEKAEVALAQAMKTAGTFTQEAFEHSLDYASALQKITVFGDETILTVQKLLSNYGAQGKELDDLTAATLDFATATGMSLEGAAALVGKTIGSTTNALTRYGITVDGAVGSTERMQSAVEGISDLFAGAAQAEAQTYAGRIQQLNNRWGDFIERIGDKVIPFIEEIIKLINDDILPLFEDWIESLGDSETAAEKFGDALKIVISNISDYIEKIRIAMIGARAWAEFNTLAFKKGVQSVKEFLAAYKASNREQKESNEDSKNNFIDAEKEKAEAAKIAAAEIAAAATAAAKAKADADAAAKASAEDFQKTVSAGTARTFESIIIGAENVGNAVPSIFENIKKEIIKQMSEVLASKAVKGILNLFTGGVGGTALGLFGLQGGVRNFAGGMALVGEKGPEIAKLPSGTNIIPAGPSRTEIHNTGSKGGDTFIINVNQVSSVAEARRQARATGEEFYKSVERSRRM